MATTLEALARLVDGTLSGNPALEVRGAATLSASREGDITLIDGPDKLARLDRSPAAAVVVPRGVSTARPSIAVDDIHAAFTKIVLHFAPQRAPRRIGVSPQAIVSPSARLGHDVDVHAGAWIGDEVEIGPGATIHAGARIMAGCRIGAGTTIFPNAVLYENTLVGPRCLIHAGAVLGAYGFGYRLVDGTHQLTSQLGYVELEADVEIGANTTVDRGTYGPTVIGQGTKLDNLVQIGHNCRLGRHNLICSQVGIAGSSTTGDYVVMAGKVGVRDHVHVGSRAIIGAQTGVHTDIDEGAVMLGSPARPMAETRQIIAAITRLPEMRKQFKALVATVEQLEARQTQPPRHEAA